MPSPSVIPCPMLVFGSMTPLYTDIGCITRLVHQARASETSIVRLCVSVRHGFLQCAETFLAVLRLLFHCRKTTVAPEMAIHGNLVGHERMDVRGLSCSIVVAQPF
jgi:hypothetical protein